MSRGRAFLDRLWSGNVNLMTCFFRRDGSICAATRSRLTRIYTQTGKAPPDTTDFFSLWVWSHSTSVSEGKICQGRLLYRVMEFPLPYKDRAHDRGCVSMKVTWKRKVSLQFAGVLLNGVEISRNSHPISWDKTLRDAVCHICWHVNAKKVLPRHLWYTHLQKTLLQNLKTFHSYLRAFFSIVGLSITSFLLR